MNENIKRKEMNKTAEELREMYDNLVEDVRDNISLRLMDTSEDNPLEVYIPLERNAVGLSTLEMPTVTKAYQDPSEGIIMFHIDGNDDDTEFDYLDLEDLIQIAKELEES